LIHEIRAPEYNHRDAEFLVILWLGKRIVGLTVTSVNKLRAYSFMKCFSSGTDDARFGMGPALREGVLGAFLVLTGEEGAGVRRARLASSAATASALRFVGGMSGYI